MKQYLCLLKKPISVVLLFIVIGIVLYANSFQNQMFWDDEDNILKNRYVQNWRYFPKYFSENLIAGAGLLSDYWRPMLLTVFSLEWHLWKSWPVGYHFVNTSFHIADAILLFFILFYIFKNHWLAFFTSLVFLVHPLQTEAVTYVSGLADPLSAFFIFLGLLFYLKLRISKKVPLKSPFYFLSLLMYIFALMSKETAIVMPIFIFIVDFFFLNQNEKISFKYKLKKIAKAICPFLVLAGFYILLRATVFNFRNTFNLYSEENIYTSNFYVRLFTFFRVLLIYFGLLFWPFNLHMERTVEIATSLNSLSVIFGALISVILLILAFTSFRQLPILSFGIFWFFIGLAPTSNLLVPVSGLLYEHWLYLPLIGIFIIFIWLGMEIGKRYSLEKTFVFCFSLYLVFFSILTVRQNTVWHDPITFYSYTLKFAPNSYRIINNLGMAYSDEGNYKMAEKLYRKAITLDPLNPVAYHNLANLYQTIGKTDLAIKNYKKAVSLDPNFVFSYNALVDLYLRTKNYQEARQILEDYLKTGKLKIDTFLLLAQIAIKEGNVDLALDYLERALSIDPDNQFIKKSIIDIKNLIQAKNEKIKLQKER